MSYFSAGSTSRDVLYRHRSRGNTHTASTHATVTFVSCNTNTFMTDNLDVGEQQLMSSSDASWWIKCPDV